MQRYALSIIGLLLALPVFPFPVQPPDPGNLTADILAPIVDDTFGNAQKMLEGRRFQTLSNALKTRHDTVKNSINNIR